MLSNNCINNIILHYYIMPLFKLRNPFGKTKKRKPKRRSPAIVKRLLSSGEHKQIAYLKTLIKKENAVADVKLGKSLNNSFDRWLSSEKKRKTTKRKSPKRKSRARKSPKRKSPKRKSPSRKK